MHTQKKSSNPQEQIPQPSHSYKIKIQYENITKLCDIPHDIELRVLVRGLRKWFQVPPSQSIFLHLKTSSRILGLDVRLSQLIDCAILYTQKSQKTSNQKENKCQDITKSHEFMEKDVIKCEPFIELRMIAQETTG